MENLQESLEDKFMLNIINILKHNTSTTKNQKTEIITIFKQRYIHELINIDDCEAISYKYLTILIISENQET